MFRKSAPYLIAAVFVAAGVLAWRNFHSAPPRLTAEEITSMRPDRPARPARTPASQFDFLSDTAIPYQLRIARLRDHFATGGSEPDLRSLYQLLETPAPASELPEHGYVIANDIMQLILTHETDPQRYADRFTALLNSPNQPEVIRDYAVQFLAAWLNPLASQSTSTRLPAASPELASAITQSLAAAATDPALAHTSIPGTTLMMLADLTRSGSEVDYAPAIEILKPWLALALEENSTLPNPTRVSAVSAAALLAPAEFRPVLRDIAYRENDGFSLRLPAIAALGQAGEEEDLPKLQAIAAASPVLAYAAADAAAALAARLGSTVSP
jgi:hypothetical protein